MRSLHAFNGVTGAHIKRLTAESFSYGQSINANGSITATVLNDPAEVRSFLAPYKCILAILEGSKVIHAGYVERAPYKRAAKKWQLEGGGCLSVLDKRLVLNYSLASTWKDGQVVVDEEHPKGNWPLIFTGSYSDIISKLITETQKWGTLPIVPAALTGGNKERIYNSYDLATVSERIIDIGNLEDAPEFRFEALLDESFSLRFHQVTSSDNGEIVSNHWRWNALVPSSGVLLDDEDLDGSDLCSQAFCTGGREEDRLLVARYSSDYLTDNGYPVLQVGDTTHSSVSMLGTLQAYARGNVAVGRTQELTIGLNVDSSKYDVRVGDWADVRVGSSEVLQLKIVDINGHSGTPMVKVQCRERV